MADVIFKELKRDEKGEYWEFRLSNKPEYLFQCDYEDIFHFDKMTFYVHVAKSKRKPLVYMRTPSNKGKLSCHFHRHIMGVGDYNINEVVDHIDRNTFNCRKYNLRVVTSQENIRNCDKKNKEKCEGVYRLFPTLRLPIGLAICKVKNDKYFQAYYHNKCVSVRKCPKLFEQKVRDFIKNNNLEVE